MTPEPAHIQLRDAIVNGAFQANEHLVEADLSKQFGISRAAIRTALLVLEQEGLVVREPNRGARVRLVSEEEAVEILDSREVLEGVVARRAAENATPDDCRELRKTLTEMRDLLKSGDLLALSDKSPVLHDRILEIAKHETATRLISQLKSQIVRFQYRSILTPGRPEQALAEHTATVEAIEAKDPDAAEAAMRNHIAQIRKALQRYSRTVSTIPQGGGTDGQPAASPASQTNGSK